MSRFLALENSKLIALWQISHMFFHEIMSNIYSPENITAYDNISEIHKHKGIKGIVIFGTGPVGEKNRELLESKGCEVVGFTDNYPKSSKGLSGHRVEIPETLFAEEKNEFDAVVLTSNVSSWEMFLQLQALNYKGMVFCGSI